jgi:carboxypeptidase Q
VYTTHENYLLLWRLMKRGRTVLELNVSNTLSRESVNAYNVVAELPGTEKPDEVVIVGAHLDSWDLGTGTTDNGINCMAVLEAARALKAVGARPRRTIRFILFNGEEQGLLGAKAYVKQHKEALAKHSAVLIIDIGQGPVEGISLHGRDLLRPAMAAALAPVNDLGVRAVTLNFQDGTDHLPFLEEGVPAFAFQQDLTNYLKSHHSESDTFDKVDPEIAKRNTAALAVAAYRIAMLPELFPRQTPPAATNDCATSPSGANPNLSPRQVIRLATKSTSSSSPGITIFLPAPGTSSSRSRATSALHSTHTKPLLNAFRK